MTTMLLSCTVTTVILFTIWRPNLIKNITKLERVQSCATKYILGDEFSDYKSCLIHLHPLLLMYYYELIDLMLFVKGLENLIVGFDISSYVTFSDSSTRFSMTFRLKHTSSISNTQWHFYSNRLLWFWNSLLPIDSIFTLFLHNFCICVLQNSNQIKSNWIQWNYHVISIAEFKDNKFTYGII